MAEAEQPGAETPASTVPVTVPPATEPQNDLDGLPWGSRKIAVVTNPASGKFLGKVGLWQVRKMFLHSSDARAIVGPLQLADLPILTPNQAAGRAMKTFIRHGETKPEWDMSMYTPIPGDQIEYAVKKVKGPQWIIHRTIVRKGKTEEKPQRISENLARLVYIPEVFHTKNKAKVIDAFARLEIEEYNPEHAVMGPDGLAKILAAANVHFEFYQMHYTAGDIRQWLQNRLAEVQGASLKPGVTFILEKHASTAQAIKSALSLFREKSNAGGRFTTGMQLLPVIDTDEERDYIAAQAAAQAAAQLRMAITDTIAMCSKVDADEEKFKEKMAAEIAKRKVERPDYVETEDDKAALKKYQEKAVARRVKIMGQLDDLVDENEEYRKTFANVLERRVAYSDAINDAKAGGPPATDADAPVVMNPRFAGIAAVLKKKFIVESVEDILGFVPADEDMEIEGMGDAPEATEA